MIKATKEYIIFSEYDTTVYPREKIQQMPHTKDNAFLMFLEMITKSWTYERLTEKEQRHLLNTFEGENYYNHIKGNFETRWEIMNTMYSCFLSALDYTDDPVKWRETA